MTTGVVQCSIDLTRANETLFCLEEFVESCRINKKYKMGESECASTCFLILEFHSHMINYVKAKMKTYIHVTECSRMISEKTCASSESENEYNKKLKVRIYNRQETCSI